MFACDATAATQIVRRKVRVRGQPTSVSLEAYIHDAIKEMAQAAGTSFQQIVNEVAEQAVDGNLSRALRLAVVAHYRTQLHAQEGRGRR